MAGSAAPWSSRCDAARLDDSVLAVGDVDVLGVMAAWDAGDPAIGDIRADDHYRQPVFFS
jgi:hypothetical protein